MSKPGSQKSQPELRIVLVGKTGAGRTSTMNTFLGKAAVKNRSMSSDKEPCETATAQCGDQKLFLADTLGLCHTSKPKAEVLSQIIKATFHPEHGQGPHVFLYVHSLKNGFSEDDVERVKVLKDMFGDDSINYFFPLFTNVDKELSEQQKNEITTFIKNVGFKKGKYAVINNKGEKDQITEKQKELVDKINEMVRKNKPECYTKEMFEKHVKKLDSEKLADPENEALTAVAEDFLTPILGEALTKSVLRFNSWLAEKFDKYLSA